MIKDETLDNLVKIAGIKADIDKLRLFYYK